MRIQPLFALALFTALSGSISPAQQPDGGPPPPPPAQHHGPMDRGPMEHGPMEHDGGGGMRSNFRILPPGIWWKNPDLIQKLTLTADQQKRMDDIFQQSRIQLVHIRATLEEQQILLEPMLDANPPDSAKVLAQIGRIADTRAELEKANARMLLGIREVLTPDQWTKVQTEGRENRHRMMWRNRTAGEPGRPSGPGEN
jgi:Spy/CpxP family protein refolding chaperone